MTIDRANTDAFPPGDAAEVVEGAQRQLVALTNQMHRMNQGTPGIRPNPGPSMAKLDPSTRRLVQLAVQRGQPVSIDVYRKLLQNAGVSGRTALEYINSYVEAKSLRDFAQCIIMFKDLLPELADDSGQSRVTVVEAEFKARIRMESIAIPSADEELTKARRDMAKHPSIFGWVTSVASGFQIMGPSPAICSLLEIPFAELDGSRLLEDPLRSLLQRRLANFAEWALIMGMLVYAQREELVKTAAGQRCLEDYLAWLAQYADSPDAIEQVAQAPDVRVNNRSLRADLEQTLAAARGNADWPSYDPDRFNALRMQFILKDGRIARFEKISRPIERLGSIIGFEVTWNPERYDRFASSVMADVLDQLGEGQLAASSPVVTPTPIASLKDAKHEVTHSRTRFAWIIDESDGLKVVAVSDLLCDLLQMPRDQLVGTCVIEDPVVSKLEQVCANFGEAALIECMLVRSVLERCNAVFPDALRQKAQTFFTRARRYMEENAEIVMSQIESAPVENSGRPYRAVLHQCLRALRGEEGVRWPAYSFGALDYMPLSVGVHPLLPPNKTARFIKGGIPIPPNAPIAYLVLIQPDPRDEAARGLERAILARH